MLDQKQELIVYESVAGYKGYSRLFECHPYVRSTLPYVMKVELSKRYIENARTFRWLSLVMTEKVAVDTLRSLDSLDVYKSVFDIEAEVWVQDDKLKEVALSKGYKIAESAKDCVVVYHGFTNFKAERYFNASYGVYHEAPKFNHILLGSKCVLLSHRTGPLQIVSSFYTLFTRGKYLVTFEDTTTYLLDVDKLLEFGIQKQYGLRLVINTQGTFLKMGTFAVGMAVKVQEYVTGTFTNLSERMYQSDTHKLHTEIHYTPEYLSMKHVVTFTCVRLILTPSVVLVRGKWYKYSLAASAPVGFAEYKLVGIIADGKFEKLLLDEHKGTSRKFRIMKIKSANVKLIFKIQTSIKLMLYSSAVVSYKATQKEVCSTDFLLTSQELTELASGSLLELIQ